MIARKTALIVSTNLANAALGYITLFFISRYMTPWEYGVLGFAFGFITLFQILGSLGFPSAHIKRVSEGRDLGKCIGTFFSIKILLMLLMVSVVLASIFLWNYSRGGSGFESTIQEQAIYIMLIYCAFSLIANSIQTTFKARREIAKVQIPLVFEMIARTSATIFVAINGLGVLALVSTYIVGLSVRFIVSLYFFRGYPISKPDIVTLKSYSSFAIPMILVAACNAVMGGIDKVLIQFFWSSSEVGYYFAAFRVTSFISMFTFAVGVLLFPTFSELHIKKDIVGIKKLILKSERYLSMIIFPLVFILLALAEPIINVLVAGWLPAVPVLQILPFSVLLSALERPYQSQFLGTDKPKLAGIRVLFMVILNVIFNIILIPKTIPILNIQSFGLGIKGAAIATVISYSIGLIYSRIITWRINGIKGNPRIILHAFAAVIMAAVLYWIDTQIVIDRWYILLPVISLGFGIYLGILLILKEFTKKDFYFYLDALNIKKMFKYVGGEIKKK